MKIISIIFIILTTYSCISPQERQARMISHSQQTCRAIGYAPDTDKFRDCVTQTYNGLVADRSRQAASGDSDALIKKGQDMMRGKCRLGIDC
jgi:hypothetical protein